MPQSNGDLINTRIQAFRNELVSKYPKLSNSDELNAALDLARLILSTFTRDAQARIEILEDSFRKFAFLFKSFLSFVSACIIALITAVIARSF